MKAVKRQGARKAAKVKRQGARKFGNSYAKNFHSRTARVKAGRLNGNSA